MLYPSIGDVLATPLVIPLPHVGSKVELKGAFAPSGLKDWVHIGYNMAIHYVILPVVQRLEKYRSHRMRHSGLYRLVFL